ncbi:CatB-related O-acetyltransferase [Vibrio breoganii]
MIIFLKKLIIFFKVFFHKKLLKRKEIHISSRVKFHKCEFTSNNFVGKDTNIEKSILGIGSYIGKNCMLNNAIIGKYCSIADNVEILLNNHPTTGFVSTHPCFHRGNNALMKKIGLSFNLDIDYPYMNYIQGRYHIVIGSDVWIGAGCKLMSGVKIGDGAIVAAGSIVTKDIPDFTIFGGVPAKKIKNRFNEEQTRKLVELKWWDWSLEKVVESQRLFTDINEFIGKKNK